MKLYFSIKINNLLNIKEFSRNLYLKHVKTILFNSFMTESLVSMMRDVAKKSLYKYLYYMIIKI